MMKGQKSNAKTKKNIVVYKAITDMMLKIKNKVRVRIAHRLPALLVSMLPSYRS
jgi:hypothetical protein